MGRGSLASKQRAWRYRAKLQQNDFWMPTWGTSPKTSPFVLATRHIGTCPEHFAHLLSLQLPVRQSLAPGWALSSSTATGELPSPLRRGYLQAALWERTSFVGHGFWVWEQWTDAGAQSQEGEIRGKAGVRPWLGVLAALLPSSYKDPANWGSLSAQEQRVQQPLPLCKTMNSSTVEARRGDTSTCTVSVDHPYVW